MIADNLNLILSLKPYFNSHDILLNWIDKSSRIILEISELTKNENLLNCLQTIQREDYAFLARTTNFRNLIKKAANLINTSGIPNVELMVLLEDLLNQMKVFTGLSTLNRESVIEAAGYDVKNSLTSPYPLFISVVDGFDSNYKSEYSQIYKQLDQGYLLLNERYRWVSFSEAETQLIKDGLTTLNKISPYILIDVSMNVRLFARITPEPGSTNAIHMSATTTKLPGICFFSDGIFNDKEMVSECIFHEALHMKYLLTTEVFFIHGASYTGDTGNKFVCSWRDKDNIWIFSRAFAAFHVYAHLYLYYLRVSGIVESIGFRRDWVAERLDVCKQRVGLLRKYVEKEQESAFSVDGGKFYAAICEVLDIA